MTTHEPPHDFVNALLSIRDANLPDGLLVKEVPAPGRLAPYAAAINLTTEAEQGDHPLAHSTFVLLYDPEQTDNWGGDLRLVGHVRTQIDQEMSADPVLVDMTWADFLTSLDEAGAHYESPLGTVTRELSQSFGGLELRASALNIELRCSWTPQSQVGNHYEAWANFILLTAGCGEDHPFGLEVRGG